MDSSRPAAETAVLFVDYDESSVAEQIEKSLLDDGVSLEVVSIADAAKYLRNRVPTLALITLQDACGRGFELVESIDESKTNLVFLRGDGSQLSLPDGKMLGFTTSEVDASEIEELSTRPGARSPGPLWPPDIDPEIERASSTDGPVLLLGEPGTQKELVARAIHNRSSRRARPFHVIECSLASEDQNSFREHDPSNLEESATGGSVFFSEVDSLDRGLQLELCRLIEDQRHLSGAFRPLFSVESPPKAALDLGTLRRELYDLIQEFPIEIPPLRDWDRDDLERLVRSVIAAEIDAEGRELTGGAIEKLAEHSWPGNFRELRRVVRRAFLFADDERITKRDIELDSAPESADTAAEVPVGRSIAEVERGLIVRTLEHCGGDKRRAATILGISLRTLYSRLSSYERN